MIKEQELKVVLTRMYKLGVGKEAIQALYGYMKKGKLEDLIAVNPNFIAVRCGFNKEEMLNILITGLVESLFEMLWDTHCPHCKNVANHYKHFGAVEPREYCETCHVHFDAEADQNITINVSLHPNLFSGPVPDVPNVRHVDDRVQPVTALELLGIPTFREHFTQEIPELKHSVKIRSVTVMFTDLLHSTALYNKVGDLNAYSLVSEHFETSFSTILSNSGGIIKTIGDAVMAVFRQPLPALQTALLLQERINTLFSGKKYPGGYGLKVGLSQGTALIVNMNEQVDLFGATINLGARVVNLSDAHSVAITRTVYDDPTIKDFLKSEKLQVRASHEQLKGIPGLKAIYLVSR